MKKKNIFLIALMLISSCLFGGTVGAIDEDIEVDNKYADKGYLVVSPPQLQYGRLLPGNVYTETFTAVNSGGKPVTFNLTAEPFGVIDDAYTPIFSEATNRTKLSEWITFPNGTRYTLDTQERAEIRVRIKVPDDAIGGGQYAAAMVNIEDTSGNAASSIELQSRIAVLLYSAVDGDVNYRGRVINQDISGFTFTPNIKASSVIENLGNADFEATYRFKVEPFFGGEIAYEETQAKILLPETKRIFEQSWDGAPALGIFRATQEVDFVDENGEQATAQQSRIVIICPLWLILIIVLIITLIVISLIMSSKQRKKSTKKPSWEQE